MTNPNLDHQPVIRTPYRGWFADPRPLRNLAAETRPDREEPAHRLNLADRVALSPLMRPWALRGDNVVDPPASFDPRHGFTRTPHRRVHAVRLPRAFSLDTLMGTVRGGEDDYLLLAATGAVSTLSEPELLARYEPLAPPVGDDELPAWAARLAAGLLGPLGGRWRHTVTAARHAEQLAGALPPTERPALIAAVWLPDLLSRDSRLDQPAGRCVAEFSLPRSSRCRNRRTHTACRSSDRSCRYLLSWSPGSGHWFGAVVARDAVEEVLQLFAQSDEVGDLFVDLGQALTEQGGGRLAGTFAGLAQREQFADVGETQSEALGALDEAHPVDGAVVVAAVVGRGPRRWRKQTDPFVVADRVGLHAHLSGQADYAQGVARGAHAPTVTLGARSKVKSAAGPICRLPSPLPRSDPGQVGAVRVARGRAFPVVAEAGRHLIRPAGARLQHSAELIGGDFDQVRGMS